MSVTQTRIADNQKHWAEEVFDLTIEAADVAIPVTTDIKAVQKIFVEPWGTTTGVVHGTFTGKDADFSADDNAYLAQSGVVNLVRAGAGLTNATIRVHLFGSV